MLSPPDSPSSPTDAGSPQSQSLPIQTDVKAEATGDTKARIRRPRVLRQRVKVSHQKVRTGCGRCKQRRIKCDETLPNCLRCLRINETCPGYQQPVTRIFGLSTFEGFNNDFEKVCFDSFFNGGSNRLALFQPSTKAFWTNILPQLCQVYLPLRHGVIALAYVNEPFYNAKIGLAARSKGVVNTLGVVMSHFNQSLRIFGIEMDRLSIEARVSCCVIFTALTIYLYRVGAVSSHVSAAWHFLQQHEVEKKHGDPAVREVLAPIVRRLVIDACTFSGGMNGVRDGDLKPYEEYMYEILRVPASFENYQDAYECLCNMLKYAIAMSVGNVEHGTRVDVHLQSTLRRFEVILSGPPIEVYHGDQLSEEQVDFYKKDLMLQHRVARLISWFRPEMLETSYWMFVPEFQSILDQIQELIRIEPNDPWRITLGWLPPLFLVATKCRVSAIRKQALDAIHRLHRVERGWTSCVAYTLAKFVIDHEEENGLPESVAVNVQYIHLLSVKFNHDEQLATLKYLSQKDQIILGTFSAQIPMKALSKTLTGAPAINVPDPVLQAFGYSGTTMFAPRVQCHCLDGGAAVRYKGKITETGKEEVVVWEAGIATFKTVRDKSQSPDSGNEEANTKTDYTAHFNDAAQDFMKRIPNQELGRSTMHMFQEKFPLLGDKGRSQASNG